MHHWTPFPYPGTYRFEAASLPDHWARLHRGDAEPLPTEPAVLHAWALFHNGDFQQATEAGLTLDAAGATVANKATCIYANYLEPREEARLLLLKTAARRAEAQQQQAPDLAGAWYWEAYALGRYSQGISVAKALAQGLGLRVKTALETTLRLAPHHADAHLALAAFHAEVIDKVGSLIGGMTYGARKDTGLALYQQALALNPDSPITLGEYASGLLMLEGKSAAEQALSLQERCAAFEPLDAMERLYVDAARVALRT